MGLTLIVIGLVFLFNPNFNIIDALPDFIGLVLVSIGMAKLSRINEDMRSSRKMFLTLTGVEFLKLLAIFLIRAQDKTWYLLLSFSFGIVECLVFIYAIIHMFNGFDWLAVKHDSSYILGLNNKKSTKDRSSGVKSTFIGFFVTRTLCATLPEFTLIIKENMYVDYTKFRPVLYILGALITLIYAVVYLVRLISFFRGIIKDKTFVASLEASNAEFLEKNKRYYIASKMRVVMLLYSIAILTTLNPTDDGLVKLPYAVAAIILIVAAVIFVFVNRKALFVLIPALPLAWFSVTNAQNKAAFYGKLNTKFTDVFFIADAAERYAPLSNAALLENALMIVTFVVFGVLIISTVKKHLPEGISSIVLIEERKDIILAESKDRLNSLLKKHNAFAIIAFVLNFVNVKLALILGEYSAYTADGVLDIAGMGYQWLVVLTLVMTVLWFVSARKLNSFAGDNIYVVEYATPES